MSVEFRITDFAYPLSILRLRAFLEKSQWFSREELVQYQHQKLSQLLQHAYSNVPYYRNLFNSIGLKPGDVWDMTDLEKIPLLTKETVRTSFDLLTANNAARFHAFICQTSGTSGEPIKFYLDSRSNVLEFCYYWRYWSWFGYRLRSPFAQFSIHHFAYGDMDRISQHSLLTNMLILNSSQLSTGNIGKFIKAIRKHAPKFIKGAPSTLYVFARLLEAVHIDDISFSAVFTTGELLLPHQREKIEEILQCKIIDSYGHMERTVAISQCPVGNYHVHDEYGILEIREVPKLSTKETTVGELIGTGLHSYAMPLIRYKIGDLVEFEPSHRVCSCGRGLPIVKGLHGRTQDVIITEDDRFVTNMFVIFQFWEGVQWFQFIQEDIGRFTLLLVTSPDYTEDRLGGYLMQVKKILGEGLDIDVRFLETEVEYAQQGKYRPIISKVDMDQYLGDAGIGSTGGDDAGSRSATT